MLQDLAGRLSTCPVRSTVSPRPPKLLEKERIIHTIPRPRLRSEQNLTQWLHNRPWDPYFLIKTYLRVGGPFFFSFVWFFSHPLFFPLAAPSAPLFFLTTLSSGGQWKLLRRDRVSVGYTKLDPGTYRGPEGKPANYSSSHGGSCCLSPSICGHRESADRPACFYLPSISIQGDEACQGFTGTGNVSLAPGVSVV